MDNLLEHYQIVLHDLEQKRARYKSDLADIEQAIGGIRKLMAANASLFAGTPQEIQPAKYAGMSVRWAILNLLAEDASGPMTTAAIADAIVKGGIIPGGKNFSSNVSAVISDMARIRSEVRSVEDGGYELSDVGKQVWTAIKHSSKYINRSAASTSVQ